MFWLALFLPRLALDALAPSPSPRAVVECERIVVGDALAEAGGVRPGLRLSAALSLLPGLQLVERDRASELALQQRLACVLGALTPEICLLPSGLLLEIRASLRLFGGAGEIRKHALALCVAEGVVANSAMAPTPLAAEWLAQAGQTAAVMRIEDLPGALGSLPAAIMGLSAQDERRLENFGVRCLGDVFKLPRAGLARRLGVKVTERIARALGDMPDPRPRFVFPDRFSERLELHARVDHAGALAFAGQRLLSALCGWLAVRQSGVLSCRLLLEHERGVKARAPTLLTLGFASATRELERCQRVLQENLQTLSLPASVEAICLQADTPLALPGRAVSLFAGGASKGGDAEAAVHRLVERLRARLGTDQVYGLALRADYRPENATRCIPLPVSKQQLGLAGGPRPCWLLAQPQALSEISGRPVRGGALQLLSGPERIESGWWDEGETGACGDVRRDYFVARSSRGEWLWIYRDVSGWFMHGFFS